jgi:hypothetical protein
VELLTGDDPAEIAGYQLRARLGHGGMGRVYLALTPAGRPVALKVIRLDGIVHRDAPGDWDPWTSGPFTVAAGPADRRAQLFLPSAGTFLTSIEVARQTGGWQISLIEPRNALTFPVGSGGWTVSDHADRHGDTIPVAASGGWLDDQRLRAEVIFLETPHRTDITCFLPGRTADAVWRHPPLGPSRLQDLHFPG